MRFLEFTDSLFAGLAGGFSFSGLFWFAFVPVFIAYIVSFCYWKLCEYRVWRFSMAV